MKLTKPAKVGSTVFNVDVDERLVIECAQRNYRQIKKSDNLPIELICLTCLATQPTERVINNDNTCCICGANIDPYNLSDVDV
jgi:hypothetical protein